MTPDPPAGHASGPASALGPHCLGVRVVVRHILPGTAPSGGPLLNDVLGELVEWGTTTLTVRREDGSSVVLERSSVVAGKPVPPRPPVRLRVPVEVAERRAVEGWPPLEREAIGEWLLRASGGFSARGNSALAVGDPGVPWESAVVAVRDFYASRGLLPRVQVVAGSDGEARFRGDGWEPSSGYEVPVSFLLAGVAGARRATRGANAEHVRLQPELTPEWLADDERALRMVEAARGVLTGPAQVVFASVVAGDEVVAKGRASLSSPADWVGITDVRVAPAHRRSGLAVTVMAALLGWAGERGATTAYLQVRTDNEGALELYDRLGFAEHHQYWYLSPTTGG